VRACNSWFAVRGGSVGADEEVLRRLKADSSSAHGLRRPKPTTISHLILLQRLKRIEVHRFVACHRFLSGNGDLVHDRFSCPVTVNEVADHDELTATIARSGASMFTMACGREATRPPKKQSNLLRALPGVDRSPRHARL
jgi:hypothetical protein